MRVAGIISVVAGLMISAPVMAGGIAYVDYGKLMREAPQVKASDTLLKKEFAPRLKAISDKEAALRAQRKQLNDLGPGANPLKRASLIEKFHHTRSALQKDEQSYQSGLSLRRDQLQGNFKRLLDDDIEAYAKTHGINLVIRDAGIYTGGPGVDITADILHQLKQDYQKAQAQVKSKHKP